MDFKTELSQILSSNHLNLIESKIVHNPILLELVFQLYFDNTGRINQNAARIILNIAEEHTDIIQTHIPSLIKNLQTYPSVGIRRNTLRILQFQEIPKKQTGIITQICFDYLTSKEEPIAVKVFAMTILTHITKKYPALKNELITILKDLMEFGSAGIQSRGRKMLKLLIC